MSGRKLVLIGDSLTRQHFMELLCTLWRHSPEGTQHDTADWIPFTHPAICGASRCSHRPGAKALLSNSHCYRFTVPLPEGDVRFAVCHEYVLQNLDNALRGATRKFGLTEHDIIVLNTGAHADREFNEHIDQFAATVSSSAERPRPTLVFRESAPFHLYAKSQGNARTTHVEGRENWTLDGRVGLPRRPCSPTVQPWFDSPSGRRSLAIVSTAGVPVLRVGEPLRQMHDAHLEHGDCSHYCQQGVLSMWNDVLFTYITSLLDERGAPTERENATFRWPPPQSSIVIGPGFYKRNKVETMLARRTYMKPIRQVDTLPHHAQQLYWDPETGEVLAYVPHRKAKELWRQNSTGGVRRE